MVKETEFLPLSIYYKIRVWLKVLINKVVEFESVLPEKDYVQKVLDVLEKA